MDSFTLRNHIYAWKQELYPCLTEPDLFLPDELEQKLRQWFAGEELLMIHCSYPDYECQCAAHQHFLAGLQCRGAEPMHHRHLQAFLRHWMRQHDLLYDRHFLTYFQEWEKKRQAPAWYHWNPEYVLLTTKLGRIG